MTTAMQRRLASAALAGLAALVLGGAAGGAARAATIVGVSPEGEVASASQVVVRFDRAVVPAGDLRAADPVTLSCRGSDIGGRGRWLDERRWAWDFARPLPPGVQCTLEPKKGWLPLDGALEGRSRFAFSTGGPAVLRSEPWAGATIEEEQHFILHLSGPVDEAQALARAACEVDALAERLPLQPLAGAARQALLQARGLLPEAERILVARCARPLPPGARLQLVWGAGIAARQSPALVTRHEQRLDFRVREAFQAEFTCARERASAPCMPVRPFVLRFSAPVPRALAAQARLQPAAGGPPIAPFFDADDRSTEVHELVFRGAGGRFAEGAQYAVRLPDGLKDVSGRDLANARSFPLAVATGEAPPLAKFAAAPFGVLEAGAQAALPITLRHLQDELRADAASGQVRVKRVQGDAEIIAWYRRLRRWHESRLSARELGLPEAQWFEWQEETDARGRRVRRKVERTIATRERSLLADEPDARRLTLPRPVDGPPRALEVVGLPLPQPGYHVVEVESRRLGAALLDPAAPMHVRTGVLVTNLAVHFKQGREDALVWVTTLDRARPVDGAALAISDCRGRALWHGRSDARGLARVPQRLRAPSDCEDDEALFVSARKAGADGVEDMAFVFEGWNKGIEPWRFALPVSDDPAPERIAHTVFDRTLLRAGQTVSMKHFLRGERAGGLSLPSAQELPTHARLVHVGSGREQLVPLAWQGVRSATSQWTIPVTAALGRYQVELVRAQGGDDARSGSGAGAGEFRVEAFRVPLLDARLAPPQALAGGAVAPRALALDLHLAYLNGGALAAAPAQGQAWLRPRDPSFDGYEGFVFDAPRKLRADGQLVADAAEDDAPADGGRLVADRVALRTDAHGAARFDVDALPSIERASELLAEVEFRDPVGEVQTVAASVPLWPAAVVPGIRTGGFAAVRGRARVTALALDTAGRPLKGQALSVRGRIVRGFSTRRRLVGGFYAWDHRSELQDLGELCRGRSDAFGRLECELQLQDAGEVELIVQAQDDAGRRAEAAATVWVTRAGQLWFDAEADDRIELVPDKRRYEGGEVARLQVRMPFREATALVTVEREGVIDAQVVTLRGDDPQVQVKIEPAHAPNVFVSVLALRGRVREVPWSSLLRWGWRSPLEWARAYWYEGREYRPPTAMVDLARPSFRLGVAALQVGLAAHELQVRVTPEKPRYGVRQTARVRVQVQQGGRPVPGAELAFAAVDEGLLALQENTSWDLLQGLMRERAWGVQTSTAQSEVIGRRHFGRKAVPAGGGGGRAPTRELFDTLLLWQPRVALDARGEATIEVPLNDSLTRFRLVAIADDGAQRFGTGSATLAVTQDLQLLPGLPPLVREGDRFDAVLTLRNTTARAMTLRATLQGEAAPADGVGAAATPLPALAPQDLSLPAGGAREISWPVSVPAGAQAITWQAEVQEQGGSARDRLRLTQRVEPAVPTRVLQASIHQLDGALRLPVQRPAGALPGGGLDIGLQARLAGDLPGLRRFFERYPYTCLEQQVAKAVGLGADDAWARLVDALPGYLDDDGLAAYFPPRPGDPARGSDRLSAHLLALAHEAGLPLPKALAEQMIGGLLAFVEGRIERRFWSQRADLEVRKLAAIAALARWGRASPRLLGSIALHPEQWPTSALIDWLTILQRMPDVAAHAQRLAQVQQLLRTRLAFSGSTLGFADEAGDDWWWLMDGADANALRLILAVLDDPVWRDELPRMVSGALARQRGGAWGTTTANVWGVLALRGFSRRFESAAPGGRTRARVAGAEQALDWSRAPQGGTLRLPWPPAAATLELAHEGAGRPWASVQALAALPLTQPLHAGFGVVRSVVALQQRQAGQWSRGDIVRVRLEVQAGADRSWVVLSDPLPAGATVLGSGLARDSQLATRGERSEGEAWVAYDERATEAFRRYYGFMPRGRHVVEYTLRLNSAGHFTLPPTRVQALYAPDSFGEAPNAALEVLR